jgi:hypothetical protein
MIYLDPERFIDADLSFSPRTAGGDAPRGDSG